MQTNRRRYTWLNFHSVSWYVKTRFIALMLGMAVFRLGYADYYLVPSASMYPTLREVTA
jgi:signal peptidase I